MIGCEGVRELAQAWLDGELGPQERERLELHLHACPSCRHAVESYRQLFSVLAEPALPEVPRGFAARSLALIAAAQRRRRAWQALAIAAAVAIAGAAGALLAGGALPPEVSAVADAMLSLDWWQAAWQSVGELAGQVAAAGGGWLRLVPGGPLVLVLMAGALACELFLAYRWRTVARGDAAKRPEAIQ